VCKQPTTVCAICATVSKAKTTMTSETRSAGPRLVFSELNYLSIRSGCQEPALAQLAAMALWAKTVGM
jgi:hypothetical protein